MLRKNKTIQAAAKTSATQKAMNRILLSACPAKLQFAEGAENNGVPSFDMELYNGGVMNVGWWGAIIIDLSGLRLSSQTNPVYRDHDYSKLVGHTTEITIGKNVVVKGKISAATEAAVEVVQSAKNGFPWQASLGADPLRIEEIKSGTSVTVNGITVEGPITVIREALLIEATITPLGADNTTRTNIAAKAAKPLKGEHAMNFSEWLKSKGFDEASLTPDQLAVLKNAYEAEQAEGQSDEANAEAKKAEAKAPLDEAKKVQAAAPVADPIQARNHLEAANEKRIAAIRAASEKFQVEVSKKSTILASAIGDGWTPEKAELEFLLASRPAVPSIHVKSGGIEAQTLKAAVALRAGRISEKKLLKEFGDKNLEAAHKMGDVGIQELIVEACRIEGKNLSGRHRLNDDDIRAGFTTVTLPSILKDTSNKVLLDGYENVEPVAPRCFQETSVKDFKPSTIARMTASGILAEVGTNGELAHGKLSDDGYTAQAKTRGEVIILTRQMIKNDDLGAFLDILRRMGMKSASTLDYLAMTKLMANADNFLHAGNHKNLITGAGSALSISGVSASNGAFAKQMDANKMPLGLKPNILLVPAELEDTARAIVAATSRLVVGGTAAAVTTQSDENPHRGRYEVVSSQWLSWAGLTGSSAAAWYHLINRPGCSALILSYLDGQKTPIAEQGEVDFNQLGMGFRVIFDVGVDYFDYRAVQKNAGA